MSESELQDVFTKLKSSYALVNAIFEDYTKVVSEIEGVENQQVAERINHRAKQIFTELQNKLPLA